MPPTYEPTCRQLHFDSWPHDKPLANLRFGTDIPRGDVRWLWPDRLPLGRLSLLVGDPGVGKSLLLADIAARHSAGLPFPCGTGFQPVNPLVRESLLAPRPRESRPPLTPSSASQGPAPASAPSRPASTAQGGRDARPVLPPLTPPPGVKGSLGLPLTPPNGVKGGVLFVSPEDGLSATLQPRLVAAGASLKNILAIDGVRADKYAQRAELPFTLPEHFDLLEDALQPLPAPRLVVLDPFNTLLSPTTHATRLITVLRRLSLFAARHEAAVVLVAHLVKASTLHVLYRVRGSLTISGAARAGLLLSADPLHPDRRVLSVIKSVYSAPPPPLAFDIVSDARADHPTPRLEWCAPSLNPSIPPLNPSIPQSLNPYSCLHDACAWLTDFLAAGPRDVHAIHTAAARDGHTPTTLRRAKGLLALHSLKPARESPWQWSLPDAIAGA